MSTTAARRMETRSLAIVAPGCHRAERGANCSALGMAAFLNGCSLS